MLYPHRGTCTAATAAVSGLIPQRPTSSFLLLLPLYPPIRLTSLKGAKMDEKSSKHPTGEDEKMPTQPREWPTKANWIREDVISRNLKIARIIEDWAKDPRPEIKSTQRMIEIQKLALESVNLLNQARRDTGPLKLEE
jgi:hypothetical protein